MRVTPACPGNFGSSRRRDGTCITVALLKWRSVSFVRRFTDSSGVFDDVI